MSIATQVHLDGGCAPVLDEAVRHLYEWVAQGFLGDGAQFCVWHQGELLADVAIGTDGTTRPNRRTSLYTLWCTGKPLTALAIAQLVDAGRLGYDDTVGAVLTDGVSDWVGGRTIREVLTHRAGLHHLTAQRALLVGPSRRRSMALRSRPPAMWRHETVTYSEHGAWEVLGAVINQVTGQPAGSYITQTVLAPLGLDRDLFICMTDDDYERVLDRMGVNVFHNGGERVPLLFERTRASCTEVALGFGARGSAQALAELYRALLGVWHSSPGSDSSDRGIVSPATLKYMTSPVHELAFDTGLDRECRHGLGFMVDLSTHAFGPGPAPESFGHSGYGGTSFAFADPSEDLAVAVVWNGHIDGDTSITLRRKPLVSAVYRLLGLTEKSNA